MEIVGNFCGKTTSLDIQKDLKQYENRSDSSTTSTIKCDYWDEMFVGETKLDQHTCRIRVSDPEYFDMYMKNWYIRNACIPVFSRRLKRELILVHSEHCWENANSCSELPPMLDKKVRSALDSNGLLHV